MKRFEGVLVRAEREKKWDLYLVSVSEGGYMCALMFSQITCCLHHQSSSNFISAIPQISTLSVANCYR